MPKFEDTKLLKHPTVERAFNVMLTFFEGGNAEGEAWAKQAVRAGEVITANAKTPDPDAIAASILMNGMIIPYEAEAFELSVSPKAAEYLKKFYDLDLDDPKFTTAAEEQVLLAQSIVGLEGVQKEIDKGIDHIIEFRNVQQILDANDRALQAIARNAKEKDMLQAAQAQLVAAQQSLADIVTARTDALAFENTGLPDNPVVRSTYEEMKKWALDGDPLGGYALTNAGIARVLVETNATTDPEVISAALLNQYTVMKPAHKKPEAFSPRIGELYEQTSPWADLRGEPDKTTPKTPEAQTITSATLLYFIESNIKDMPAAMKAGEHVAEARLEFLEDMKAKVEEAAKLETQPGLKARMEKAVKSAETLINAPESVKIRKPGSPKREPGW